MKKKARKQVGTHGVRVLYKLGKWEVLEDKIPAVRALNPVASEIAANQPTLEQLRIHLSEVWPDYFIYKGGTHIAVHRHQHADERLFLIAEPR